MLAEVEAHLPLDHGLHQQPHHREHSQRRNPFGFLQPYRPDGGGMLDPAKTWFYPHIPHSFSGAYEGFSKSALSIL